jgi:hypothetical protein
MKKNGLYDVAIVGAGPAGLSAAFILASQGGLNVIVLDQGDDYENRILSYSSGGGDLLHGVGGAGTLTGGKLCGIPASMELWHKTWHALPSFVDFLNECPLPLGAKIGLNPGDFRFDKQSSLLSKGLLSKSYPSTLLLQNDMKAFVQSLYSRAKLVGCTVVAQQTVTALLPGTDHFIIQLGNADHAYVNAKTIIFATGRSSAGSIEGLLHRTRARIVSQSPDLGIRLRMPYSDSDLFVNYGQDIKIKRQIGDISVRTFCVCTGGDSALINLDGISYVDGHFTDQLTNNVNIGIVTRRSDTVGYLLAKQFAQDMGSRITGKNMTLPEFINKLPCFEQNISNGKFKRHVSAAGNFIKDLMQIGGIVGNVNECEVVGATIDRYWPHVETNQFFETHQKDLYVIGDAAGVSRGYIQSMWSANCAAHAIIRQMNASQHSFTTDESVRMLPKNGKLISLAA